MSKYIVTLDKFAFELEADGYEIGEFVHFYKEHPACTISGHLKEYTYSYNKDNVRSIEKKPLGEE